MTLSPDPLVPLTSDLYLCPCQRGYPEVTLMDCMRLFTKEDVLDGDEKPVSGLPGGTAPSVSGRLGHRPARPAQRLSLLCPQTCCRCRARRRCLKKFSIQRFPKVLVLRILRTVRPRTRLGG